MKLRMAIFAAGLSLGALWVVFAGDVKSWTPPPGPPPKLAYADLRRRLLLVHGAAVRRGAGRLLDDLGLRRRPGQEPDVRAGLERRDRPRGVAAGRLRPAAGHATSSSSRSTGATSTRLTAAGSSATAAPSTARRSSTAATSRSRRRSRRRRPSRPPGGCRGRWRCRSSPSRRSTRPRTTTRTSTRRTPSATSRTEWAAAATGGSRRSGARRRVATASSRASGRRAGKGWTAVKDGLQEAGGRRAEEEAHAGAVRGDAAGRHRDGLPQRVLEQPRGRDLRGRGVGRAALLLARQVRLRHRLAQLHAGRSSPTNVDDAHGHLSSACAAPRSARSTPTPTSATSSTTARRPTGLRYCMNSASLRFVPADEARRGGLRRVQGPLHETGLEVTRPATSLRPPERLLQHDHRHGRHAWRGL